MNFTVIAMEKTWQWVVSVLDVAEGQLRQGQYFETQVYTMQLHITCRCTSWLPYMYIYTVHCTCICTCISTQCEHICNVPS